MVIEREENNKNMKDCVEEVNFFKSTKYTSGYFLTLLYRCIWSSFLCCHLFDFLFSATWMHGYIWSLNQYIDIDLSDKSTIVIVEHHLNVVGIYERMIHSILITIGVIIMAILCKYHQKSQSIWHFLKLTVSVGGLCGISRCFQMKQRLYPTLHEGFFTYLVFFVSGACILIQFEKLSLRGKKKDE